MCGYPLFSFWISVTLVKIYVSCIIINRGKNTFELVGTVLNCQRVEKIGVTFKSGQFNVTLRSSV